MAKQQFSTLDRWAFSEVYNHKCYYCKGPARFSEGAAIDHIIPEYYAEPPQRLAQFLESCRLPVDFDIASDFNLIWSCFSCNNKKGGDILPPQQILIPLIEARKQEPLLRRSREKHRALRNANKSLATVAFALESGVMTSENVLSALGITGQVESDAPPSQESLATESEIRRIFGVASLSLLAWPQTTADRRIERPELEQLKSRIDLSTSSLIALLGEPGSGKSALLARFATELQTKDVAMLAIKADQLPREMSSVKQLDDFLGLQAPLEVCIRELANQRIVVILIDQVDALSDLMDQHTDRLTVLLSVIRRIRAIEGVHILLSCRDFEFRHDVRLKGLDPDFVTLVNPTWDAVNGLLASTGTHASGWPAEVRELLQNPQHLSLFVKHLAGDGQAPSFRTYQSMLELVLRQRVLDQPWAASGIAALEGIARVMSESEELWLPISRFEQQHRSALDHLLAAQLLTRSNNQLQIGFRHQTIFDFVRARSFAAERGATFSEYVIERQEALFVRPTVWSTLSYLRSADPKTYLREFGKLWRNSSLRIHLRCLLIDFLGQLSDPDANEVRWLIPLLDQPKFRAKALLAVVRNSVWFEKLEQHLPKIMRSEPAVALQSAWVLGPAAAFARLRVLDLVEAHWLPNPRYDSLILQTFVDTKEWDERSIRMIEEVVRRSPSKGFFYHRIIESISTAHPQLAPRIVSARLWCSLEAADAMTVVTPPPPCQSASDSEVIADRLKYGNADLKPVLEIVSDSYQWSDSSDVANRAPRAFVESIWPWFLEVAGRYSKPCDDGTRTYQRSRIFDSFGEVDRRDFTSALEQGVSMFASADPEGFISFVEREKESELLIVHRMLARGLVRLPTKYALVMRTYITEDPRRLLIGPMNNVHENSCELIRVMASGLNQQQRRVLERHLFSAQTVYLPSLGEGMKKAEIRRWNQQHRLRLLRAFPPDSLSARARKLLSKEEEALPKTPNWDWDMNSGGATLIQSPMSTAQMLNATDVDLFALFEEFQDAWVGDWVAGRGGQAEAMVAFGEFSKKEPSRALRLIAQMQPRRHERYAARALRSMSANASVSQAREMVEMIDLLSARGFESDDFRHDVAWALGDLAVKAGGLRDQTIARIENWLKDQSYSKPSGAWIPGGEKPPSVLFDMHGGTLPGGNYPILRAMLRGYFTRNPSDPLECLCLVERHLRRSEDWIVWSAILEWDVAFLATADSTRASAFIRGLFARYQTVRDSVAGAQFVARSHFWLARDIVESCLSEWTGSRWHHGPQAASEVAMVRHAHFPEDIYCRDFVEQVLTGEGVGTNDSEDMRIGLAIVATELWAVSGALAAIRSASALVLVRLLSMNDLSVAKAVFSRFHRIGPLVADEITHEVLELLPAHALLLKESDAGLVARLKELLAAGGDPVKICRVLISMVDIAGSELANVRRGWAVATSDLIEMSITLQRVEETRSCGLDLFERLMDVEAYGVDGTLKQNDRRF